jgi:hypothetical protein
MEKFMILEVNEIAMGEPCLDSRIFKPKVFFFYFRVIRMEQAL